MSGSRQLARREPRLLQQGRYHRPMIRDAILKTTRGPIRCLEAGRGLALLS